MKIIFACRNGVTSYYIASRLYEGDLLQGVLVESGSTARKQKIDRIFKKMRFWQFPVVLLDLFFLFIYQKIQSHSIRNYISLKYEIHDFPEKINTLYVEDINDSKSMEFLKEQNPDILVVQGTAILKNDIIKIPRKHVFNIHGGIVPKYRNVHSDFWAFMENDYENIGTSILYLDEGVDTGDIAIQDTVIVNEYDSLLEVKKKNLELAGDLIIKVLDNCEKVPCRIIQDKIKQRFYSNPGSLAFIKFFIISLKNKLKRLTLRRPPVVK